MKILYLYCLVITVSLHGFSCKNKKEPIGENIPYSVANDTNHRRPDISNRQPDTEAITEENNRKSDAATELKNPPGVSEEKSSDRAKTKPAIEKPSVRPVPEPEKPVMLPDDRKDKKTEPTRPDSDSKPVEADVRLYQRLLQSYVSSEGKVNYAGLKREIGELEKYTLALSDDPRFQTGNNAEKLALWINTYNAYTLLMVARNYPINSIRDLHAGKPWDAVWIRIGKKNYSLNQIENDIIRPLFKEPRIHFVLNCAARSCPPLLNTGFTDSNLENLMEKATKSFINGPKNNIREKTAEISSIFDWYRDDFGDVIAFLNTYSNVKIKQGGRISYMKYDWSLNH